MHSLPYLTLDKDVRQVRQSDVDAFAAQIRGGALGPADDGVQRSAQGLERHRRSPPGADRALPDRQRCPGRRALRRRASNAAQRARWRPSHRRQRSRGGRSDDRPVGHARDQHRRREANRARRRRGAARRPRSRSAGARPGHAARHQFHHRRRRTHARRRLRLADAPPWHDHRQSAERHRRDGRRYRARRLGHFGARPVLGPARRRRQLRRGDLVRVPVASGRPRGLRRPGRLSVRAGPPGPARVARLHRRHARRAERVDGAAQGASAAVPSRIGARHRGGDLSACLQRRRRSGQARRRPGAAVRRSDRDRAGADALRRVPVRLRSAA